MKIQGREALKRTDRKETVLGQEGMSSLVFRNVCACASFLVSGGRAGSGAAGPDLGSVPNRPASLFMFDLAEVNIEPEHYLQPPRIVELHWLIFLYRLVSTTLNVTFAALQTVGGCAFFESLLYHVWPLSKAINAFCQCATDADISLSTLRS